MAFLVVDTSFLYVLTAVQRLDLLAGHKPLLITKRAKAEHDTHADPAMQAYLDGCIAKGLVEVRDSKLHRETYALQQVEPGLSATDANAILFAQSLGADAWLLAEDRGLLAAADRRGVDTLNLAAWLAALKDQGMLDAPATCRLLASMEAIGHKFSAKAKHALGCS